MKFVQHIQQKIRLKILIAFIGLGVLTILVVGFYSFNLTKKAILNRTFEQLTTSRVIKTKFITDFLEGKLKSTQIAATSVEIDLMFKGVKKKNDSVFERKPINSFMTNESFHDMIIIYDSNNFSLAHFDGKLTFNPITHNPLKKYVQHIYKQVISSKKNTLFDYIQIRDQLYLTTAAPVYHSDGSFRAILCFTIPSSSIDNIMITNTVLQGLGNTGETYLVDKNHRLKSQSRFIPNAVNQLLINTPAVYEALEGNTFTSIIKDYRGIEVLSSSSSLELQGLDWVILAEIDKKEILAPILKLRFKVLSLSAIVIFIFIALVTWITRQFSKPLIKLKSIATEIAHGDYGKTLQPTTRDEIGQLTEAFNAMSQEILNQREELIEKNKEIQDSINYAKRIQLGLLPSKKNIYKLLEDSFVLYLPKNTVSGDFYYCSKIKNKVIVAVGDCTGHGVPGAFVSALSHGLIQRTINAYGITQPATILDKLHVLFDEMFSFSELSIKDGMDISICSFDFEKKEVEFAGANNPVFRIRKGELDLFEADRQPIGGLKSYTPFTHQIFNLQEGDCYYLLSDGLVDQFGGAKNKKFMRKNLKQLLLDIHELPMKDQKLKVNKTFQNWKGTNEQVDDICIFGIKI
ncbi:Serine phosphatase RsbU, regulator of sigma subunit [Lishizhenia tianjinensis]|uniref:Serine phosphatase RsbU, regulator of sigma subunit n=1 Tax=Lishizhenia tianjinensis TaxID=477690 RepID=A0A1I7AGC7_9FLAO|nr:SpoIIE family protein phosphatase [Lishizhenia tianjinensis]SFT73930.1 Serine phosphatase RsbU, regulator of sigma subunit [Lishizhenia tianjinensis]